MKNHKSTGLILLAFVMLAGCSKSRFGELTGVEKRKKWAEPAPYGMNYVHQGSLRIGPSDQDVTNSGTPTKTVSVDAFWMDDTEITNNEYRQFVYWVRDSIARKMLVTQNSDFEITQDKNGNPINPPVINWKEKIDWKDHDYQEAMQDMYIPEQERFMRKKEIDPRKLIYEYWWIDLHQAARRANSYNYETQKYEGNVHNDEGVLVPISDRSSFIKQEQINVYPDTLTWIRDFTYSYNEPLATRYFWHPGFDEYPVVGVNWAQAMAFCNWRTNLQKQ